tara:strand:+ start:150 stop:788 length:639 start_codon:yes stop_codon:yes gene_type:complete
MTKQIKITMVKIINIWSPFCISAALLSGCASTATYVEPGSGRGIVSVDQINTQDWINAAEKLTNSLLQSGVLNRDDGEPFVLMIGRVRNNTTEHIDTDGLVKKIRVALNKSGKVKTTTAVGIGGPEDASSQLVRELRNSKEFKQSTVAGQGEMKAPSFSLSGKITQSIVRAGRTKQSDYTFELSLTNLRTGLADWEDEHIISKQGKRASVGF